MKSVYISVNCFDIEKQLLETIEKKYLDCVLENVSKEASDENECVKNIIDIKDVTKEYYTILIKWYQAITNVLVDAIDSKMGMDCKN